MKFYWLKVKHILLFSPVGHLNQKKFATISTVQRTVFQHQVIQLPNPRGFSVLPIKYHQARSLKWTKIVPGRVHIFGREKRAHWMRSPKHFVCSYNARIKYHSCQVSQKLLTLFEIFLLLQRGSSISTTSGRGYKFISGWSPLLAFFPRIHSKSIRALFSFRFKVYYSSVHTVPDNFI